MKFIFPFILFYVLVNITACNMVSETAPAGDSTLHVPAIQVVMKFVLPPTLKESSGLCYTDGNLWTFCDGGNPSQIYKIDTSAGAILQTVTISNFPNTDWEDMTADSSYIYIGDFGNNRGDRRDLKIIRVRKSDLQDTAQHLRVKGDAIQFSYADQKDYTPVSSTDFDCESMLWKDHFIYIFSKNGIDFKTRCYKIPDQPGTYSVSPISTFDTKGKITAADFNPVTGEIALLGYVEKRNESFIWFLNGYTGDNFFSGTNARVLVGNLKKWQTEGLVYISGNYLFINCESTNSQDATLYAVQRN